MQFSIQLQLFLNADIQRYSRIDQSLLWLLFLYPHIKLHMEKNIFMLQREHFLV